MAECCCCAVYSESPGEILKRQIYNAIDAENTNFLDKVDFSQLDSDIWGKSPMLAILKYTALRKSKAVYEYFKNSNKWSEQFTRAMQDKDVFEKLLGYILETSNDEILQITISEVVNVESISNIRFSKDKRSVLHEAAMNQELSCLKYLVEQLAIGSAKDDKCWSDAKKNTPLHYSAKNGCRATTIYLIENCGLSPLQKNVAFMFAKTPKELAKGEAKEYIETWHEKQITFISSSINTVDEEKVIFP